MKKISLIFSLLLSLFSFSNFLDDLTNIDKLMQKNEYEKAYEIAMNVDKTELTEDNILILDSILQTIEEKLPQKDENVEVKKIEDKDKKVNLPVSPVVYQKDKETFYKLNEYEEQILIEPDSMIINELARYYIRLGLIERAANISEKDPSEDIENLFIAATARRMMGDYDKAIALYEKVLNKDSSVYKAYLGIAISYKQKEDFYRASRNLKKYASYVNSPEILKQIEELETLE
ncbi:tetratricopeptide repeat protein [Oceanivirga miroungae]|uniref:Uncharacterized protein n=1 Tax=Oceanivirga miroungae TaxID=1130046 RepID=A0A6I8M8E3_9FUSO|nr:hypothetical protein [Oceanivirga miroungae]VWL85731.1 hypothetical protein OMES3154_01019 [Oceanivirga miroungae]